MNTEQEHRHEQTRLIPLTKWNDYYPWPTVSALRWYVFHEKTNGFDRVVRRIGRRVLLNPLAFFEWCEEQNAAGLNS